MAAGPLAKRPDVAFFGEAPTLVLVSVGAEDADRFEDECEKAGVPCFALGRVGGSELEITVGGRLGAGGVGLRVSVTELETIYESALPRIMGE